MKKTILLSAWLLCIAASGAVAQTQNDGLPGVPQTEAYTVTPIDTASGITVRKVSFLRSQATKMAFSAIENIYLLTQPVLLVVGEKADSEWQTKRIYDALPGKDKEVFTVKGYSHIDLYDKPGAVNPAVEKLTAFFKRTLYHSI